MPCRVDHQKQLLLLSPDLGSMIPPKNRVRVIRQVVEMLPRTILEDRMEQARGRPSSPPRTMLKVLVYAYTQGL